LLVPLFFVEIGEIYAHVSHALDIKFWSLISLLILCTPAWNFKHRMHLDNLPLFC